MDYHVHTCLRSGCLVDVEECGCSDIVDGADCQHICRECVALNEADALEEANDG